MYIVEASDNIFPTFVVGSSNTANSNGVKYKSLQRVLRVLMIQQTYSVNSLSN